jgi:glyoxylase-like metal-dependent hydrolase (beta-lactamase superfamily II)
MHRRQFLATSSHLAALCALEKFLPLPTLASQLTSPSPIPQSLIVDKGFASVRKIGDGLYATISDPSKGFQTTCNGGILIGKHAAFLIEGFNSPAGAAFQMDALRTVSQLPVMAALDTHYHYDHSMGNSFYGAAGVPLWAHASVPKRIVDTYAPMQGVDREAVLAPFEKRVKDAKSDLERAHAQTDVSAMIEIFNSANGSLLGLPNHPLDPAKLPLSIDLGGLNAVLEFYPGHSGTDIVVRVPDQNVVYTGDLLFNGKYPVCFDQQATVSGWRQTLQHFAAFDPKTIFVPGHGPLCGQEGIAVIREVFDDIAAQAQRMYTAGIPVEEAQHRYVVPAKFKNLSIWSWSFTIGTAISNLYSEWHSANSSNNR